MDLCFVISSRLHVSILRDGREEARKKAWSGHAEWLLSSCLCQQSSRWKSTYRWRPNVPLVVGLELGRGK